MKKITTVLVSTIFAFNFLAFAAPGAHAAQIVQAAGTSTTTPAAMTISSPVSTAQPIYLLAQWGSLHHQAGINPIVREWKASLTIEHGTVNVVKEVLFEDGDAVTAESKDIYVPGKSLTLVSHTSNDWDGLIIKIIPENIDNNTVTIERAGQKKVFAIRDLYTENEMLKFKDGPEVAFLSLHRVANFSQAEQDLYFSRKSPVLDHFFSIEKYLNNVLKDGSISTADADKFSPLLQKFYLLNYSENMKLMVDNAFQQWKTALVAQKLNPKQFLRGLKTLLNKLNNECGKNCVGL